MITRSNRSLLGSATAAAQAFVEFVRQGGTVMLDILQGAYDSHLERAQMRLAPAKPRSWRDIPRAGSHHSYC